MAQAQIFSSETLHGIADIRITAADGERGWLDGGFGKTAASGAGDGGWQVKGEFSQAALEWRPKFSFGLSGYVTAQYQPSLDGRVDLGEAFLKYRGPPTPHGRWSARAGLFFPPVSMEHDGVAWTTPDMLSASAINSWIGEEVRVVGVEGSFERRLGEHEVSVTGAVFGGDDTSGTLLSFRGWALHDIKAGVGTRFDLPVMSPFMRTKQARDTMPLLELDRRAGYYGRVEWRPPIPVSFNALYYDNAGSRVAMLSPTDKQWSWETRFLNLGARWEPDETTKVLAQVMNGETMMGIHKPAGIWLDMGFSAAYVLASRQIGDDALSGRMDWFATKDRTFVVEDDNNETGWALTGAWRHRLAPHADLLFEAMRVSSKRPSRALVHEPAKQDQTVLQTALRLSF
ncbi:MAG: hypothetical protein ABI655_08550 [Phenylobacterium sp.]